MPKRIDLTDKQKCYQSRQIGFELEKISSFFGLEAVELLEVDPTDQGQPLPERPGHVVPTHVDDDDTYMMAQFMFF